MSTRVIKMLVAYDGTAYSGFQRQKNARSVQAELERVFRRVFGEPQLTLVGAGRTDAGVHAAGQVVSVRTSGNIAVDSVVAACNGILPCDIAVKEAAEMGCDFHALGDAKGKLYVYRIYNHAVADPFVNRYAWQVKKKISLSLMWDAAQMLLGTHDFSAFRSINSSKTDSVRTIYDVKLERDDKKMEIIKFHIKGNGFLYHMVRNIVGSLVEVGKEKMSLACFRDVFLSGDRSHHGRTAPPQGLFLQEVYYDEVAARDRNYLG